MSSTPAPEPIQGDDLDDFTAELRQALDEAVAACSDKNHQWRAMYDATTALLIRHRLPLDGGRIAAEVTSAATLATGAGDPQDVWARGCAAYVSQVAAEQQVTSGA